MLSQVEAANIAKQQVRGSCGLLLATGFETYSCCSYLTTFLHSLRSRQPRR